MRLGLHPNMAPLAALMLLLAALALSCGVPGPGPEEAKAALATMRSQGRLDDVSETNFVYCAFMSDVAAVKLYLASGMSPDVRNRYGRTPLIAAITNDPSSPWSGQSDAVIELLVAHGADVNARDDEGASPLALARKTGRTGIATLLECKGAKE